MLPLTLLVDGLLALVNVCCDLGAQPQELSLCAGSASGNFFENETDKVSVSTDSFLLLAEIGIIFILNSVAAESAAFAACFQL